MAETTTKEDIRIDADEADELNREAADDLERIERAVKQEAEEYVEAVDGDGNEKESVEAAATAFDFDEAEGETERLLKLESILHERRSRQRNGRAGATHASRRAPVPVRLAHPALPVREPLRRRFPPEADAGHPIPRMGMTQNLPERSRNGRSGL